MNINIYIQFTSKNILFTASNFEYHVGLIEKTLTWFKLLKHTAVQAQHNINIMTRFGQFFLLLVKHAHFQDTHERKAKYGVNYYHLKDLTALLIHYERIIAYFHIVKGHKYAT